MRKLKKIICTKLCRKDKILATRKQAVRKFKVLATRKNKGHVKFSSREKREGEILVTRNDERQARNNSRHENWWERKRKLSSRECLRD